MEIFPKWDEMTGMNCFMRLQLTQILLNTESSSGIFDRDNCKKDAILQKKIDFEIKMRDGTAKLLAACKHQNQILEAAKNLLTSNTKMITYMTKLQEDDSSIDDWDEDLNPRPSNAEISLSGIRIPLMWKENGSHRCKLDHGRYAVFCLIKIGTEIHDTILKANVDSSMTDIVFEDVINFSYVEPHFECTFEVFCHKIPDDMTASSTPKRIRKKITEISNSVGKRLSGYRDEDESISDTIDGPKFEKIGHKNLKLVDVSDRVETYNFSCFTSKVNESLPLFGNFCCKFLAQPYCHNHEVIQEYLELKSEDADWKPYFCKLNVLNVSCWKDKESSTTEASCLVIPFDKFSYVTTESIEESYSFELFTSKCGADCLKYIFALKSEKEGIKWYSRIRQNIVDQKMWQQACEKKIELPRPSPPQGFMFSKKSSNSYTFDDDDSKIVLENNNSDHSLERKDEVSLKISSGKELEAITDKVESHV